MRPADAESLSAAGVVRRKPNEEARRARSEIRFDYIKSNHYRVVYADGFHGGLTPNGKIHMAIFNERRPIARSETYRLTERDGLGEMEFRIERDAVIREVETSVLMDLDKAMALFRWLEKIFKKVEELQSIAKGAQRRRR